MILSGIYNRLSFSVGQFHTETDGVRDNNDADEDIYNAFLQAEISTATSAQIEFRATDLEVGDRRMLFDPTNFLPGLRSSGDTSSIRLGGRHTFAPGSVMIGSYVHRRLESDLDTGVGLRVLTEEDADFMEFRYLQKWKRVNLTAGFGYYAGSRVETRTFGPFPVPPEEIETRHSNGYVYADVNLIKPVTVTAGLAHDDFRDGVVERSPVNPKLGVTWEIDSATTLRGAAFRVVERTLISGQTIEPTQVAGPTSSSTTLVERTRGGTPRRWTAGLGETWPLVARCPSARCVCQPSMRRREGSSTPIARIARPGRICTRHRRNRSRSPLSITGASRRSGGKQ